MPITSKIKVGDQIWLRDQTKGTKEPFVCVAAALALAAAAILATAAAVRAAATVASDPAPPP
jgi:hypothetical protein